VLPAAVPTPAPPPPVVYAGRTAEGRALRLEIRGRRVARLTATLRRYRCATFGDIGPLRVDVRPGAPLGRGRTFAFTAGPPSERLAARGTAGARRASGRLRVVGTIATGDPCRSRWVRFRVARR
jgi:hypothetical protein